MVGLRQVHVLVSRPHPACYITHTATAQRQLR